jgi:hypothetical protein
MMNNKTAMVPNGYHPYLSRIRQAVDDVMAQEDIFSERFYRSKIVGSITRQMKTLPLETFLAIPEYEFRDCVGRWMASQLVDGIMDWESICPDKKDGRNGHVCQYFQGLSR